MNLRRSWKAVIIAAALALLAALASGVNVRADDVSCTGTLGAISVDNLVVPQNAACTLNGTVVNGNIYVEANATLNAYDVQVDSNIQAGNAASVNVYSGSIVGGNILIISSGSVSIQSVDIASNLYLEGNDLFLDAANNTISGNLQAYNNSGGVSITGNIIGGNLQCRENVPPPTGSGNIVNGNIEDQCAGFDENPTPAPTEPPPTATNTPPAPPSSPLVPQSDIYTLTGSQIRVSPPGILTNDSISTQNPVQVSLVRTSQHGTVTVGQQGDFVYQMHSGYYGPDSFEYLLTSAGVQSNPATVQLSVIDQEAPSVEWTTPVSVEGRYDIREGEQVIIEVTVNDNFSVGRVKFLRWDAVNELYVTLENLTQPPFRIPIDASSLNPGWNQIFVVAWDLAGNRSGYSYIWIFKEVQEQTGFRIYLPSAWK